MKCISLKKVEWEPRVICLNRRLVAICQLKSRVKGCLNITNFPAKKLRKNTVLKNTHAPDFFFPSYNFISLPINLYLFLAGCLLILSFTISKHVNKVDSSVVLSHLLLFFNVHLINHKSFTFNKAFYCFIILFHYKLIG